MIITKKLTSRQRRHRRLRKRIVGTDKRPRLNIRRSLSHLYVQLIDDLSGKTLLFLSTNNREFKKSTPKAGNIKAAEALGAHFAKLALSKGIKRVVFDRGGYPYHGRIKVFAEASRKLGLEF